MIFLWSTDMMLIQALDIEFRCLILVILSFDLKNISNAPLFFPLHIKEGQKKLMPTSHGVIIGGC